MKADDNPRTEAPVFFPGTPAGRAADNGSKVHGSSPALSAIFKSDLFSNLLPEEKKTVTGRTGVVTLRQGGVLFSPGERAEHLYFLSVGQLRIFKPNENGADEEIARFAPGDIIGDFDFARGAEYDARAEALEDSALVMFPGLGFTLDRFALEAPHIVSKILINSVAMVTGRIKTTRKLVLESMSWVQELQRMAHEDPGTGLWKQSFLIDEINRLLEDPTVLIMLKPDRFKVLVDSRGHEAGDEAMVKIAGVLKNTVRKLGRGWALRFRSNETGILVNKCDAALAETLALSLARDVAALPPIKKDAPDSPGREDFSFSVSVAWGIWPTDSDSWDVLFEGIYRLLMETWKAGEKKIVRYQKEPL